MEKIEIFGTELRDGEQSTCGFKQSNSKLIIAKKLAELGVNTIEAGNPRSRNDFNPVQDIARQVHGPFICGLARALKEDIDSAWEAVKDNENPMIHFYTMMVDSHSQEKYNIKDFNSFVKKIAGLTDYAKQRMKGRGRLEFSAQNATIAEFEQMHQLYSAVIENGADVINIPDTAGRITPSKAYKFIKAVKENIVGNKNIIISIHAHNDLGLAAANSIEAVTAGARQVEGTFTGFGERAGNTPLEEVVMAFKVNPDLGFDTNINTKLIMETAIEISSHSRVPIHERKPIIGRNAFSHKAGVHQDGVKKGVLYTAFDPNLVGRDDESIYITDRSGKGGFELNLRRLGYKNEEFLDKIREIINMSYEFQDQLGILTDYELRFIADEVINPVKESIIYKGMKLNKDNGRYEAVIRLNINENDIEGRAIKEGAVDAIYTAINSAIRYDLPELVIYTEKNIGIGKGSTAKVSVVLSDDKDFDENYNKTDRVYIGVAKEQDSLESSAKAYIYALNRFMESR